MMKCFALAATALAFGQAVLAQTDTFWAPPYTDFADDNFLDSNGDGMDGTRLGPIYVAQWGHDYWPGSRDYPKGSINVGILTAKLMGRKEVYVAAKMSGALSPYYGSVVLVDDISLVGGFDENWNRILTLRTQINGTEFINLQIFNAKTPMSVRNIALNQRSLDTGGNGQNAVGVHVFSQTNRIHFGYCDIVVGAGANGKAGANGANGAAGQSGGNASGRTGGTSPGSGTGGLGGRVSANLDGNFGAKGSGTLGGAGGAGGAHSGIGAAAGDGKPGANGANGGPGPGGIATQAFGLKGGDGDFAQPGYGGGGGGGGGSHSGAFDTDDGGGGGGGGGGGSAGWYGTGGQAGGASVGIYDPIQMAGSSLELNRCTFTTARAGNGGAGGNAGVGGFGAPGGAGYHPGGTSFGGDGGDGGAGGDAGFSGGGAGGCGGYSAGVVYASSGAASLTNCSFVLGTPGSGGAGGFGGNFGQTGKPGLAANTIQAFGLPSALYLTYIFATHIQTTVAPYPATTTLTPATLPYQYPYSLGTFLWANPQHGTITINAQNFSYQPSPGYTGYDTFTYQITGALNETVYGVACILVAPTVSGRVQLEGNVFSSYPDQNVILRYYDTAGNLIREQAAPLDLNGNYTAAAPYPPGPYTVRAKAKFGLSQARSYNTMPGSATGVNFTLKNGDIDGDDVVSVFDYGVLSDYFDRSNAEFGWTTVGPNGFAPRDADLDSDGVVSVFDYGLLSNNFDKAGPIG